MAALVPYVGAVSYEARSFTRAIAPAQGGRVYKTIKGTFDRPPPYAKPLADTPTARMKAIPRVAFIGDRPPVPFIKDMVCAYFKRRRADMTTARRTRDVVRPRQMAMYLAIELTNLSLPTIGRLFGGRDHTTVLHARRAILSLVETSDEWRIARDEIWQAIMVWGNGETCG